MLRPLTPIDLVTLVPFNIKAPPNLAKTKDSLAHGGSSMPWVTLWADWLPVARKRRAWMLSQGPRIQGVISIRRRCGPSAWEVDYLRLRLDICEASAEFLDKVSMLAGSYGAEKLFIRFQEDSPWIAVAEEAGFTPYLNESLYYYHAVPGESFTGPKPPEVRKRFPGDDHGIFQIFCQSCPAWVRSAEGLTFREWQETREALWTNPKSSQYVLAEQGVVKGWVGIAHKGAVGYMDLLLSPDATSSKEFIEFARSQVAGKSEVLCLVPQSASEIREVMLERGFQEGQGYTSLMKQVTDKLRRAFPVPAGV